MELPPHPPPRLRLISESLAYPKAAYEYGIAVSLFDDLFQLGALVLAINHATYLADPADLVA